MIFITLGSQKFQFNRVLEKIDRLIEDKELSSDVYAQIGYSDYLPQNYKYKKFLNRDEFSSVMNKADIVITHGGTGAIVGAIKKGKKVIAIPRLSKYKEHVDDHQLDIVNEFVKKNLIASVENIDELGLKIKEIENLNFKRYISNTNNFVNDIEDYIEKSL